MRRVIALLAWTALVLTPLVSSAQIGGGGSIQGLVLDTSNLAVPGATVMATNVATGINTTAQTTSAGVYALRPLPPGEYRVTVTLAGFQTVTREGIIVDALGVVGLNVTLPGGGRHAGRRGHGVVAAARDGRRPARPDDPQRRLHRAAARDEYRRTRAIRPPSCSSCRACSRSDAGAT